MSPRPLSRLLGDAMMSLARTWRALLVPAVTVSLGMSVAAWAIFEVNGAGAFLDAVVNNPDGLRRLPDEVLADLSRPFYLAAAQIVVVQIVGSLYIALAGHLAVAAQTRGETLTAVQVSGQAARRFPVGLGSTLLALMTVGILLGSGLLLWVNPILSVGTPNAATELVAALLLCVLVGPGIWAGVVLSMTAPVVAIEGGGVFGSLRRSMQLVRGRWWATARFLVMVGLLGGIAILLIQVVALPLSTAGGASPVLTLATALGAITQGMLVAAIAGVYTHWYFDLRARKGDPATSWPD
ncbi:MAG: hypothetical protein WCE80_00210 [Acidimicrobiia bacterium]